MQLFYKIENHFVHLQDFNNNSMAVIKNLSFNEEENNDFDNLTQIYGPIRDPLYIVIPITVIYMLIFVTGVIGNISTCIVISKNRSMHTATNYYLFSLAISDFLLLLSGVPPEVYFIWSRYPYVFGETFCVLRGLAAETAANATVLTITAFTVERYVAICHPFLSHTMSKLSRAVRLILLVWIISIALAIPQALQFGIVNILGIDQCSVKRVIIEHSFELSTFLFFFAPMTLITVLYVLIGLKLRASSLMKRDNGNIWHRRIHVNSCRQQTNQGTRRVLKMLVAVVVAFFICWAPFHAQRLVAIYGAGPEQHSDSSMLQIYVIMTYISGVLYYLSTCINPLLYNLMSNKFREAFKETLEKCCQYKRQRDNKERSYRILSRNQRRQYRTSDSAECSGNSVKDESMYSSSTQKQSVDSIALSRGQSLNRSYVKFNVDSESDTYMSSIGLEILTEKYNEEYDHRYQNSSSVTPCGGNIYPIDQKSDMKIHSNGKPLKTLCYKMPPATHEEIVETNIINDNNHCYPFSTAVTKTYGPNRTFNLSYYINRPIDVVQNNQSDFNYNTTAAILIADKDSMENVKKSRSSYDMTSMEMENELDSYMEEIKMREKR